MDEQDEKTVYDYGLEKFCTGELILTKSPFIHESYRISVRNRKITLEVFHYTTVGDLKSKIQVKTGIASDYQELMFTGKPLSEDEKYLEEYHVGKQSTLYVYDISAIVSEIFTQDADPSP